MRADAIPSRVQVVAGIRRLRLHSLTVSAWNRKGSGINASQAHPRLAHSKLRAHRLNFFVLLFEARSKSFQSLAVLCVDCFLSRNSRLQLDIFHRQRPNGYHHDPSHVSTVDGRRRTNRAESIVPEGAIKILRHGAVVAKRLCVLADVVPTCEIELANLP